MGKSSCSSGIILALHVYDGHICPRRSWVSAEGTRSLCALVWGGHICLCTFLHPFFSQGWIPVPVTPPINCWLNDLVRYSLCKYFGLPADFHWLYENASQMEVDKLMRNANTSWFKWVQSSAVPLWLMGMIDWRAVQVTFFGTLGGESAWNVMFPFTRPQHLNLPPRSSAKVQ